MAGFVASHRQMAESDYVDSSAPTNPSQYDLWDPNVPCMAIRFAPLVGQSLAEKGRSYYVMPAMRGITLPWFLPDGRRRFIRAPDNMDRQSLVHTIELAEEFKACGFDIDKGTAPYCVPRADVDWDKEPVDMLAAASRAEGMYYAAEHWPDHPNIHAALAMGLQRINGLDRRSPP